MKRAILYILALIAVALLVNQFMTTKEVERQLDGIMCESVTCGVLR